MKARPSCVVRFSPETAKPFAIGQFLAIWQQAQQLADECIPDEIRSAGDIDDNRLRDPFERMSPDKERFRMGVKRVFGQDIHGYYSFMYRWRVLWRLDRAHFWETFDEWGIRTRKRNQLRRYVQELAATMPLDRHETIDEECVYHFLLGRL